MMLKEIILGQKDSNYLTGKLLVAMPGMTDPRFHRSVIFMCAHDEEGAMGLVINHELSGVEFNDLVSQLKFESDMKFDALNLPVMYGGPVETARGFLLHSSDFKRPETMHIDDHFAITGTVDALQDIAQEGRPKNLLFILGYAGWDAGQLEDELQQASWLVVDPDDDLIFEGDPDEKWLKAINKLGIDPAMLSVESGRA